jgi:ribosomal protein S18 acetylase RimI-like enzyme
VRGTVADRRGEGGFVAQLGERGTIWLDYYFEWTLRVERGVLSLGAPLREPDTFSDGAMSITVRDADEKDIDRLVELNRFAQDLHVAALPEHFKTPDPVALAELFRAKLRRNDARGWIASARGLPVGYTFSVIRERPDHALSFAQRFCEIDEIAVSSAHRRQGVARALIDAAVADARARGIDQGELTSWAFNTEAHRAFQALGFRPRVIRFARESGWSSALGTPSSPWRTCTAKSVTGLTTSERQMHSCTSATLRCI